MQRDDRYHLGFSSTFFCLRSEKSEERDDGELSLLPLSSSCVFENNSYLHPSPFQVPSSSYTAAERIPLPFIFLKEGGEEYWVRDEIADLEFNGSSFLEKKTA